MFWKPPKRWLDLKIPVEEGKQYRVGEIQVEGATVFPADFIETFFKLQTGAVYDESKIPKGLESLRELYGSRGYVQFTGFPIKKPIAESDVVDVTINLNEDKQYFVNRIEFKGNTTTRDKVIRREMWLNEQDVMNMELLKMSIRRINQLGYFQPIEEPEIQPVEDTGGSLIWGIPVKRFSRLFLSYNYSVIKTSEPDPDLVLTPYDLFTDPRYFDPRFYGIQGNFTQSKVAPSFVHNTTDNPLFPFRGKRYTTSFEVAGGVLGGTANYYKPTFEAGWDLPA